MFKRNILKSLETWAASTTRKPLVMRGARQVGKTSAVNEFGKQFDNYIYLNLEKPKLRQLFEGDISIDQLVQLLQVYTKVPHKSGRTLIFIDEIQNSPAAISRLRYFYEERPDIYVISAGSLLETAVDVHRSFPVGRVQYMAMRPCSFEEYLWAMGEDAMASMLHQPELVGMLHPMLINHFNTYTLIGGMPEVVAEYARNKDILQLSEVYESLLTGYRDDVEKYARTRKDTEVIRFLLHAGWEKAGEIVTLGNFGQSQYKAKDVGEAFRALGKAMICELVYPTSSVVVPSLGELSRAPKLLWLDTGLVNYASNVQREILLSDDILDVWKGRIAEHIVGQELLTLSDKVSATRTYWSRNEKGSSAEIDFLWTHEGTVYPIEVKSGHNARLKSLHSFMDRSPVDIGIRVWSQPLSVDKVSTMNGKEFTLINLPFYLVGQLDEVLDNFEKLAGN